MKVLEKINCDAELAADSCRYVLIQEEQHKNMLEFFREHFIPDEPVSRSVGLSWNIDAERAMITQVTALKY